MGIIDRILTIIGTELIRLRWRPSYQEKREIIRFLGHVNKGGKIYSYENDWKNRESADSHFIAMFIGDLINKDEYFSLRKNLSVPMILKFRNFDRFMKMRDKVLFYNEKINTMGIKLEFRLNNASIEYKNPVDRSDKEWLLRLKFKHAVNRVLKHYFNIRNSLDKLVHELE